MSSNAQGLQKNLIAEYEKTIYNTVQIPYRKNSSLFIDSYLANKIDKE